jgi:uncharacterized LabA/DUF88 family protein
MWFIAECSHCLRTSASSLVSKIGQAGGPAEAHGLHFRIASFQRVAAQAQAKSLEFMYFYGPNAEIKIMADQERIALFIDGANLYATAKSLGFDIDYKRLLKEFQSRGRLVRAFYYTALVEDQEYSSIRPLIDWLDYNGYAVVTKPTKEFVDSLGRRKVKGNMDIELAVDAMEMSEHLDQLVLFSGDGDFRSLVEAVQRKGVRVSVVSTITTQPPMVADELRRQADEFIDLVQLVNKIGRDPVERTERPRFVERRPTVSAPAVGVPQTAPVGDDADH